MEAVGDFQLSEITASSPSSYWSFYYASQTSLTLLQLSFSLPVKTLNGTCVAAVLALWYSDDLVMIKKKCKEALLKGKDKDCYSNNTPPQMDLIILKTRNAFFLPATNPSLFLELHLWNEPGGWGGEEGWNTSYVPRTYPAGAWL